VASPAIPAPTINTLRGAPLPMVDIVNPFAFEVCADIADQASRHAIETHTAESDSTTLLEVQEYLKIDEFQRYSYACRLWPLSAPENPQNGWRWPLRVPDCNA
jgi:hypothetical protein